MRVQLLILILVLVACHPVLGQVDTLIFENGNIIVGEIKSMDKGVVQVETDYSDSDFKIEWSRVKRIETENRFLITLSHDTLKYYGYLSSPADFKVNIISADSTIVEFDIYNIVFLRPLKEGFWDRLFASIDIGFSLAKARSLHQLTIRSNIGYRTNRWVASASFNTLRSKQEEVEPISRSEADYDYVYVLPRRWYSIATVSFLSNTEQKLDMRMNAQLGMGRYLIRTNSMYLGAKLGFNRNIEYYSNETEDRFTWEGYLGAELNLYDVGDLDLLIFSMVYPGVTEKGRWRSDSSLDVKYDLPFELYIKLSVSLNYDNRPAEDASETDYVFQSGIGWEW